MIVKVQLPIGGPGPALIYCEGRKQMAFLAATAELREAMTDEVKAFFHAEFIDDGWVLQCRAPDQPW